jgi:uncharacterized membrane protein YfcA
MEQELAFVLIFLLGGFTMGFAGFGFALVAVPLLALLLPIKEAVALQFPYIFGLFVYQAWHYRAYFQWSHLQPLFLGCVMGLSVGTFLLYHLSEPVLKRSLAIFIVLFVAFDFFPSSKLFMNRLAKSPWWGRFCGFLSGSFLGAYTIGGPPAVLYVMSVSHDPMKTKSFLSSFFSVQFTFLTFVYIYVGLFTWEGLKTSLLFSPAVLAGTVAGFWTFGKASNRVYRQIVSVMLLLTAAVLWWRN